MKRGLVVHQVSDPSEGSGRLQKLRKLDRDDPALILSYDRVRATRASPVQWSTFEHIVVL
jgi:hypothetical protein